MERGFNWYDGRGWREVGLEYVLRSSRHKHSGLRGISGGNPMEWRSQWSEG